MVSLRLLCLAIGHLQEMSTCASFQVQMASIMQVLTKTAVEEITKLVDDRSTALRLEMCRSQRENEALRRKLLLMERELGAARGYGEGAPDNSLNIAFEVQFCDEFTEVQRPKVPRKGSVSSVFDERLSTGPAKDNQNVLVENRVSSDALPLDIKYEPADGEQDWPEYLLLNEDRLEDGPGRSQSQMEQKISEENTCGTLGAACADGGAGPLCEQPCPAGDPEKGLQAELKQEPEGEPVTPALPQLKVQCAWTEADGGSGTVQEKQGQPGGSSEHGGARFGDDFVPPKRRASRRLRSVTDKGLTSHHGQQQNGGPLAEEHGSWLADDISAEMLLPLGSPGEHGGSTPCEASFDPLTEAQEQHGSGKLFSSLESGEGFTSSRVLEKHQRIHSRKKPFACSWCGKSFSQWHVFQAHESIHTGLKPFACSWCGKSFSHWHVFQEHKNIHTGLKPYVCAECGKRFRYKGYLKVHRRVHTREKPFTCVQCGKCFSQISNLKTHQSLHTGDALLSCVVCNKTFASLAALQEHQIVHARQKGFICKLCGKLLESAESLKEHRLAYHRGKRFCCTLCGKGFSTKNNLKTHQIVHTGEKPHRCSECGKRFAHVCNLKTHQRVHTGEKPFSCTLCGKGFAHKCALQRHALSHSKEEN